MPGACTDALTVEEGMREIQDRYKKIKAFYLSQEGEKTEMVLEGFAAKVFQYECDHLQGIVNIDREGAMIKEFGSKDALLSFMQVVKKEDVVKYKMPPKN